MKHLIPLLLLALLTSCAATLNLPSMRGHYTRDAGQAELHQPVTIDVEATASTAVVTCTDAQGHATTVHYTKQSDSSMKPSDTDTPLSYLMSIGDGTIELTDILHRRFTYTRH